MSTQKCKPLSLTKYNKHVHASAKLRTWRMEQYLKLYKALVNGTFVLDADPEKYELTDAVGIGYFCEKGCHRSVAWMRIEGAILDAMGFKWTEVAVCRAWQISRVGCQKAGADAKPVVDCPHCYPYEEKSEEICNTAVEEFFETFLVTQHFHPGHRSG